MDYFPDHTEPQHHMKVNNKQLVLTLLESVQRHRRQQQGPGPMSAVEQSNTWQGKANCCVLELDPTVMCQSQMMCLL